MASLSVTVVDKTTLNVAFSDLAPQSADDLQNINNWTFVYSQPDLSTVPPLPDLDGDGDIDFDDFALLLNAYNTPGANCMPFKITAYTTGLGAQIVIHPEFSQASVYTLGYVPQDISVDFTTPGSLVPTTGEGEFPKGPLQVLTQAFGEEIQRLNGRPQTYLLQDFTPNSEDVIYTESTLGWPENGVIWIGEHLFTYTGKFDGGFKKVAFKHPHSKKHPKVLYGRWNTPYFNESIPMMTVVALQVHEVPPVDYEHDEEEAGL